MKIILREIICMFIEHVHLISTINSSSRLCCKLAIKSFRVLTPSLALKVKGSICRYCLINYYKITKPSRNDQTFRELLSRVQQK